MKEINAYFNDSSEGSSKESQDSLHESLSWKLNSDSHQEDENWASKSNSIQLLGEIS